MTKQDQNDRAGSPAELSDGKSTDGSGSTEAEGIPSALHQTRKVYPMSVHTKPIADLRELTQSVRVAESVANGASCAASAGRSRHRDRA